MQTTQAAVDFSKMSIDEILSYTAAQHKNTAVKRSRTTLNKRQRAALRRVINYIRTSNSYTKVTSVRYTLSRPYGTFYALSTTTRRSDCDKYSHRAIMCEERGHFFILERGGLTVNNYEHGIGGKNSKRHVARMVRGSVGK